jgi:hypothetical protein
MDKTIKTINYILSILIISALNACIIPSPSPKSTEKPKEPKTTDLVILKNKIKGSKDVQVSNDPKSWMKINEIAYVPNGTSAKILSIHDETIEAGDMKVRVLRYKVITTTDPRIEGWVFASNAGYDPDESK